MLLSTVGHLDIVLCNARCEILSAEASGPTGLAACSDDSNVIIQAFVWQITRGLEAIVGRPGCHVYSQSILGLQR